MGDTGPEGMWTATPTSGPALKDPVFPGAVGGMVYRAMGYDPLLAQNYVPTGSGEMLPPVAAEYQGSAPGNAQWLAQSFGLA